MVKPGSFNALEKAGAYYHWIGLGGDPNDGLDSVIWNKPGDARMINGPILPLDVIMKSMKHHSLSVFKFDCEGCEWSLFKYLAQLEWNILADVDVVLAEIHVSSELQMNSSVAVDSIYDMYHAFFIRNKFQMFFSQTNKGNARVFHELNDMGFWPKTCCYEIGLYNTARLNLENITF